MRVTIGSWAFWGQGLIPFRCRDCRSEGRRRLPDGHISGPLACPKCGHLTYSPHMGRMLADVS